MIVHNLIPDVIHENQLKHDKALPGEIDSQLKKTKKLEGEDDKLKKACSEFESIFINYILKEMRASIPKTGLFSGGKAEEIYTSMMDMQLAKDIALKGGFGLSKMLYEQFEKKNEIEENERKDDI
jgi:flagellar protein FlgJ